MTKEFKSPSNKKNRTLLQESLRFLYQLVRPRFGSSLDYTNAKFTTPSSVESDVATYIAQIDSLLKKNYKEYSNGCILSIILTHGLIQSACKHLNSKLNLDLLQKGIEDAIRLVITSLENYKVPAENPSDLLRIITYATDGDEEVATELLEALSGLQKESRVIITKSDFKETKVQQIEGIILNEGFFSNHFAIDKDLFLSTLNHCDILVIDEKIESIQPLLSILKSQTSSSNPLIIFAKDFADDVTSTLLANQREGLLDVVTIKLPGDPSEIESLVALSGATIVSKREEEPLNSLGREVLGRVKKVVIDRKNTMIVEGSLKNCYIRVGKNHVDDFPKYKKGLIAAFAAKKDGVVIGSGASLIFASSNIFIKEDASLEEKLGLQIVKEACELPLSTLAENLELDPLLVIKEVSTKGFPFGLHYKNKQIENLEKIGVVEGYSKLAKALQTASFTACTMLFPHKFVVEKQQ